MNKNDQACAVVTPDYSGDPQLAKLVAAWEDLSAAAGFQVSLEWALSYMRAGEDERADEICSLLIWRQHWEQESWEVSHG